MANQRAVFGRLLIPPAFRALFCYRSMPSACSDLQEVYLIETGPPYPSSRNTAYSTPGSIRACARECRTAVSPDPACRKSPTGSVVPPDDNGQDQIAWLANRKKCCDTCHPDLGIEPWFPPRIGRSAGMNVKSFCATSFVGNDAGLGKVAVEINHRQRRLRGKDAAFGDDLVAS